MLATTYKAPTPLSVPIVTDPAPAPIGAIIRTGATGLCRNDWLGRTGHDDSITAPPVYPVKSSLEK